MQDFLNITELELIRYAMKGLCDFILKAPDTELFRLNTQYSELHQRRAHVDDLYKKVINDYQTEKNKRERIS
jgi:hypothetical protein